MIMQCYPVFDRLDYEFVGIYKRTRRVVCKKIKFPCLFAHSFKEIARHAMLMNEIVDAVREDRDFAITKGDQEFIDHYNSFYIELDETALEGFNIAFIDSSPYSQTNRIHIKELLSFKCHRFDKQLNGGRC